MGGCDRDDEIISLMGIDSYQVYISETEDPTLYAVSVRVVGVFPDGCHSFHEIHYDAPHPIGSHPIPSANYVDGDTITIEITESEYRGPDDCTDAVHYYIPVLFIGFCEKGSFTLILNGNSEIFSVG